MYKILVINAAAPAREFGYISDRSSGDAAEFESIESAEIVAREEMAQLDTEELLQYGFIIEDEFEKRVKSVV